MNGNKTTHTPGQTKEKKIIIKKQEKKTTNNQIINCQIRNK